VNASALSAEVAQAAALAQMGWTRARIAKEQDCSDRAVRRRLAQARAAGLVTAPEPTRAATAPTAPDPAPPSRASVITVEDAPGRRTATFGHRGTETPEERRARTGGDGRGDLGEDHLPGDLEYGPDGEPTGRVLVGSQTIQDSGPRRRAIDIYLEPPLRAVEAHCYDEDGTLIGVVAL
jgi:hypothetical protein